MNQTSVLLSSISRKKSSSVEYLGNDKAVNKMQPVVSVCITTYNHAAYIKECLDSILMQETDFSYEIVLGEDESSDGTREICKKYAEDFPEKIRLFLRSRKDVVHIYGNPTGRFNFLENLKSSRGKYIALCEGDDYWTDSLKLQKQVDAIKSEENVKGSYTDTDILNESGEQNPWRRELKLTMKLDDVISESSPFHTASFMFEKTKLPAFPNWMYQVASMDMLLFAMVALAGDFVRVDTSPTVYRKHSGGITNHTSNKSSSLQLHRLFLWCSFKKEYNIKIAKIDEVIIHHMFLLLSGVGIGTHKIINHIDISEVISSIGKKTILKQTFQDLLNRQ